MSRLPASRVPLRKRLKWLPEAVGALPVFAGALVTALRLAWDRNAATDPAHAPALWLIILAFGVAMWALLAGAVKVYFAVADSADARKAHQAIDVYAACQVLHDLLAANLDVNDEVEPEAIRVTVYRVTSTSNGSPTELERAIPYAVARGGKSKPPGTRILASCGIIGRAARTGDAQISDRVAATVEDFRKDLIAQWGFDEEQAKSVDDSRYSWMAVPIKNETKGVFDAVVYLDSSRRLAFSEQICETIVYPACSAIALCIEREYGHDAKK